MWVRREAWDLLHGRVHELEEWRHIHGEQLQSHAEKLNKLPLQTKPPPPSPLHQFKVGDLVEIPGATIHGPYSNFSMPSTTGLVASVRGDYFRLENSLAWEPSSKATLLHRMEEVKKTPPPRSGTPAIDSLDAVADLGATSVTLSWRAAEELASELISVSHHVKDAVPPHPDGAEGTYRGMKIFLDREA